MKLFMMMLLILTTALNAVARRGGDDVGNGGGLAEKNFFLALENLEDYSEICLQSEACGLSEVQKETLRKILKAAPEERKIRNLLFFVSERRAQGTFILDGQMKVAKTGSNVGDPIYINTDLIYTKNTFGESEAMSMPGALAVLIHEIGHHVTDASHSELDLIGVRVSLMMQNRIQHTPVLPWNAQISATVIQAKELNSYPQIFLNVGDSMLNVTPAFQKAVFCPRFNIPIPILPFPDLQLGRTTPDGSLFHNVHWERASKESNKGTFVILGNLTHVCPSISKLVGVNSFKARIKFEVHLNSAGQPELARDSIRITQSYEPWYKIINLPH